MFSGPFENFLNKFCYARFIAPAFLSGSGRENSGERRIILSTEKKRIYKENRKMKIFSKKACNLIVYHIYFVLIQLNKLK